MRYAKPQLVKQAKPPRIAADTSSTTEHYRHELEEDGQTRIDLGPPVKAPPVKARKSSRRARASTTLLATSQGEIR